MSSHPPELIRPLQDEELEELEVYLASDWLPEDTMPLPTLHGFLTAIAVGPNRMPPERWLERIWGDVEPDGALFMSDVQAERVMALLFRLLNSVALLLAESPEQFEPIHACEEDDGESRVRPEYWCEGFIRGMLLDREGWQQLFDQPEDMQLVLPILVHALEPEELHGGIAETPDLYWTADGLDLIAQAAVALHAYWSDRRGDTAGE